MKQTTRSYLLLLTLALGYDLLFTLPPILLHFGINADLAYRFFQPVCHQTDTRSFHIFGNKFAVCSRCASIYYGLTIGIALYPLFKPLNDVSMPLLIYILIPISALVADFSVNFIGVAQNTFLSRSITGGFLGISTAFFFVPVWISLMKEFSEGMLVRVRGLQRSLRPSAKNNPRDSQHDSADRRKILQNEK